MQVEPGESNILDVVPFLEMEEIRCGEGLIGGVLDPVRSRFFGHGHGREENEKRFLSRKQRDVLFPKLTCQSCSESPEGFSDHPLS